MTLDEIMSNEIGEKRWKVRKVIIKTDETMRSKTVDRLIGSTPPWIEAKVDKYCENLVNRNKRIKLFESILDGSPVWVKSFSGEWFLCEWSKIEESTSLGIMNVVIGDKKGIKFCVFVDGDMEFEEFVIIKKP